MLRATGGAAGLGVGSRSALTVALAAALCGCMSDEDILRMTREGNAFPYAGRRTADRTGESGGGSEGSAAGADASATAQALAEARAASQAEQVQPFVCNYWKDTNANGLMDYPEEFIGTGDKFFTTEKVCICLQAKLTRPYRRGLVLRDGSGKVVFEDMKDLQASPAGRVSAVQFEPGQLAAGSYEAVWSIDGRPIGTTPFRVVVEE